MLNKFIKNNKKTIDKIILNFVVYPDNYKINNSIRKDFVLNHIELRKLAILNEVKI